MYFSIVEVDDLAKSALSMCPNDDNFSSLCHLLLSHRKISTLIEIVSKFKHLKIKLIQFLIRCRESNPKMNSKTIYQFFTYDFLIDIDFSELTEYDLILVRNIVWEILIETDLKEIDEITELFRNFSINIQISNYVRTCLLTESLKKLETSKLKNYIKNGAFQIYDNNYNGLIHIIEIFPNKCTKIVNLLLCQSYPKLYNENMKNILLAIYLQDKFSAEEKHFLFRCLCQKIKESDLEQIIFSADIKGNHLLSAVVTSQNFDLIKSTIKQIKSITNLKTTEILNRPYIDYTSKKILNYKDYKEYMSSFVSKRKYNPKKYEIFFPINLLEAAINSHFPLCIKYLMKKKYNHQTLTRLNLHYIDLLVSASTNILNVNHFENNIIEEIALLFNENIFEFKVDEEDFEFEFFEIEILGELQNNTKPSLSRRSTSISFSTSFNRKESSMSFNRKESIIRKLAMLDNPYLFIVLFPPSELNFESKAFCYFYLVSICKFYYYKSYKILAEISEYFAVKSLINNASEIFEEYPQINSELILDLLFNLSINDSELYNITENLYEYNKRIETIKNVKVYKNKLKFVQWFANMPDLEPKAVVEILFFYFSEMNIITNKIDYYLTYLKIYEELLIF